MTQYPSISGSTGARATVERLPDHVAGEAADPATQYNPKLFEYQPDQRYEWQVFDHITVATITWNRLEHSRRFIDSVLRLSHLPYRLLIIDNGSTDDTVPYLRQLAATYPHVRLLENRSNRGKLRALMQLRDNVEDGLVVFCDNDMEILTNYWLVLLQKAFHAFRLTHGNIDLALGPRVINQDEYGFRYATRREVLPIPAARNSEPRTSYAATSKDDPDPSIQLNEDVVIGWTEFLIGNAQAVPTHILRKVRLENDYPRYIGGDDAFQTLEYQRLGVPMGYIENGPVLQHHDWPYSDEKIRLYEKLTKTRAVTDITYIRWKLRDWFRQRAGKA